MPKYRRGSGSVYLRRKTYWVAYYDPRTGKQVCESAKTKDKAEARRILAARMGQIAEGRYLGPVADRVTFEELVGMIMDDYRVNEKKSLPDVERRIRCHIRPFFGHKKAQEITTADVKAYCAKRQEEGAKNASINRELAALRRMFNLGLQAEKILKKPYIRALEENNVRQGFFEPWEFVAVLVKLPDCLRPLFTFAYQTGWRVKHEVLGLEWSQVDLDTGTARLEVGTTKNKGGRLIYLTRDLQALLLNQWQEHQTHYPDCPYVFHDHGQRIVNYYKRWHSACREAGLSGKIPHDFRRTAVRNMVRAGIPERVAMQMTGHKTRSVFDRYHIVSDGDLREAAKRLENALPFQTTTNLTTLPLLREEHPLASH
ncbi:MAG: tyrosine-type recombinase/integrase [Deltaproteobacteria bacterium]|nr:tyrosine-type recombinase/integrase [Deltaproteobacteria bacterium]